jgi:hypothetical protein
MSPRTVEYHLHKVFAKFAISSRNQLHGVLATHGKEEPGQTPSLNSRHATGESGR